MKNILFVLIAFLTVFSYAQTQPNKPNELVNSVKASGEAFETVKILTIEDHTKSTIKVPDQLKNFNVFTLDKKELGALYSKSYGAINLNVPSKNSSLNLELVKVDITTDDFQIVEMPAGTPVIPDTKVLHYRGVVKGKPNSIVAVSFFNDEISGLISIPDSEGNIVLGRLENSEKMIIYEDKDISHLNDFACRLEGQENFNGYTDEQLSDNSVEKAAAKCPRIFFDIDTDIVQDKGGSQGATNYIQALFNQVAVLYSNENLTIKVSGMHTWTSSKPFSNSISSYRTYRNSNSFNGDLGHFVTYNFSGGVAYLGGLCNSYKYGVSGINGSFSNVPTYSWSVMVVSHELGHNFGSNHTHACVWNGNNTAIDGCYDTEGSCSKPAIPSGGGTVMSYCHLTSAGINLSKGFGSQPGNVVRNTIGSSSCTQTCDGGGCNTGDQVTVTFQNSTNCALTYYQNSSSQFTVNSGQSRQVNTTVGASWSARASGGNTVDSFTVVCNQSTYTSSGTCSSGGDSCDGVAEWSPNVNYQVGDRVTYQGNLYERTATGWKLIGPCQSSDPCAGVPEWSSSVNYQVGDRVTYQGNLYERTATGWNHLGPCGASQIASTIPMDGTNIMMYPNPVKNTLNIQISNLATERGQLRIKNINGKTIKTIELNIAPGKGMESHSVDVSNFASGVYFVQVTSGNQTVVQKIFKQ